MQLTLKPTENQHGVLSGAFIRGAFPADWLREIASWETDATGMTCYVISESMQSIRPHGLFVVFRNGKIPDASRVRSPYKQVAGKLYLPFGSELFPQAESDELRTLLFWDAYVFHPSIGLLGFEKSDAIDLKYLLHLPEPGTTGWHFAHPGFPQPPRLSQIELTGTSPEALLDELKNEIQQKPITDLSKDKPKTAGDKLKSQVGRGLLKTGLAGLGAAKIGAGVAAGVVIFPFAFLGGLFGGGAASSSGGGYVAGNTGRPFTISNDKPGLFERMLSGMTGFFDKVFGRTDRPIKFVPGGNTPLQHDNAGKPPRKPFLPGFFTMLENWMKRNLDDIEKKRQEELDRLMRLFEEDPDEALKYALPLDSPYLNRGTSPPSDQLTKRDTNFNLGRIGGGSGGDTWNTAGYHEKLREQYLKAAEREIKAGRFKKAAYIYAELLHDYSSAADVLIQGRFYREAAALYIKHLNNKPAAAECLEKGGLYLEAIKLYVELGKHEKAGDLYRQLELDDEARKCYTVCVDEALKQNDYIEASRLTREKLQEREKARQLLLDGWNKAHSQGENCLLHFFNAREPESSLTTAQEIRFIYDHHVPKLRTHAFLNVLVRVLQTNKEEETEYVSRQLAYEIISNDAANGRFGELQKLEYFVKKDRLVSGDTNRFVLNQRNVKPKLQLPAGNFQLDQSAHWLTARNYRNQFVAIGTKAGALLVARGNWNDQPEYNFTPAQQKPIGSAFLTADPRFTTRVILVTDATDAGINAVNLPVGGGYESSIHIENPTWLPKHLMGIGISSANTLMTVSCPGGYYTLSFFTENGTLMKSRDIKSNGETLKRLVNRPVTAAELIFRKEKYYFYEYDELFSLDESGETVVYKLPSEILAIACTPNYSPLRIVVATHRGSMLVDPENFNSELTPVYFAEGFIARSVQFIGEQYVVLAGNREARIYAVSDRPRHIRSITTESKICGILLTPRQHHLALLEENGRLLVHQITG